MEDVLIASAVILMAAALAFLILFGLVSLVHRLATGRYLDWRSRPAAILFILYLGLWTALLYASFTSSSAFLITH